jgi:hypothetical protein
MPVGAFEQEVPRLLAMNRNPDSYVAGATVLNQTPASPRTSRDVDIFHDTKESLAQSADRDIATLKTNGFEVIEAGRRHDTTLRHGQRPLAARCRRLKRIHSWITWAHFEPTLAPGQCGSCVSIESAR